MPATTRNVPRLVVLLWLAAGCTVPGGAPVARGDADCRKLVVTASGSVPASHSIAWTLPADSAARTGLDAYCAGVGPALLRVAEARTPRAGADGPPRAGADGPPRAGADGLVIVTWNIALGAGSVPRFIEDLRAGVFTDGVPVHTFALLLQEVPRIGAPVPPASTLPDGVLVSSPDPVPGPSAEELARAAGLHLLYVPSMREGLGGIAVDHGTAIPSMREGLGGIAVDHGTAIFSTLPLADARAIELPLGIRRRVAVAARVHTGVEGDAVYLVSAHLDNFSLRHVIGSLGGIRARQARALRRGLPAAPVVLGADLNTWAAGRREPAYRILRAVLPEPTELPPGGTARRLGVPRRLDYLLTSSASRGFTSHRIADRYGSDHHPVLGVLRSP